MAGAIILIALGTLCVFANDFVAHITFYDALNQNTGALIDDALEENQVTFLGLTAVKASMALIEGSSVGLGFELEVGDIIQPAYDYVDFFWRIFLYAFLIMGFYKILLDTGLLSLGIALVGIGGILWGVTLLTPRWRRSLRLTGKRCVVFGVLIAYLVPLSLLATHALGNPYTDRLKDDHYQRIQEFSKELDVARDEFLALKEQVSLFNPGESLDEMKTGLTAIAQSVGESFRLSLLAFLYYILLILFDLLFFPLLSAFVLYKFAHLALDRLFEKQNPPVQVLHTPQAEPVQQS